MRVDSGRMISSLLKMANDIYLFKKYLYYDPVNKGSMMGFKVKLSGKSLILFIQGHVN
jgi:hypothetical protein